MENSFSFLLLCFPSYIFFLTWAFFFCFFTYYLLIGSLPASPPRNVFGLLAWGFFYSRLYLMWTIWCRLSGLLILVIKCKQILFYAFPTMVDSYFLSLLLGATIWEHDENELSWGCVEYLKPWFSVSNRVFISSSFRLPPFHCERWKLYSHVLYFLLFTIPRRNYFHCLSVRRRKKFNLLLQSLAVLLKIISMLLTEHYVSRILVKVWNPIRFPTLHCSVLESSVASFQFLYFLMFITFSCASFFFSPYFLKKKSVHLRKQNGKWKWYDLALLYYLSSLLKLSAINFYFIIPKLI